MFSSLTDFDFAELSGQSTAATPSKSFVKPLCVKTIGTCNYNRFVGCKLFVSKVQQVRNVGLCLCRPVKNTKILFILYFGIQIGIGIGIGIEVGMT